MVAGLTLVLVVAACGTAHQVPARSQPHPPLHLRGGPVRHVAIIVMENEEYADIVGSRATPYINGLAHRYGLATQTYAVSHPSLPNYLALVSGSTHGITNDCTDCSVAGGGLAAQLRARGTSWKAYMEDMPHRCFAGASSGGYAKKHDPFIYFAAVRADPASCRRIVPFTELRGDERARRLPRLVWITPNLCHDMHDCSPATGDRFLAGTVPSLLRALGPRGLLLLTWDEGSSNNGCCGLAHGGHVVTIAAGDVARPQSRIDTAADHYSVLQTIEDLLGLRRLAGAACPCTPSLGPLLR